MGTAQKYPLRLNTWYANLSFNVGVEAHSRYHSNGRTGGRSWETTTSAIGGFETSIGYRTKYFDAGMRFGLLQPYYNRYSSQWYYGWKYFMGSLKLNTLFFHEKHNWYVAPSLSVGLATTSRGSTVPIVGSSLDFHVNRIYVRLLSQRFVLDQDNSYCTECRYR
jgi:hypothetical protein